MSSGDKRQVTDFRLRGLTCAPCTPFLENGDVNFALFEKYVDHLVGFGISNLFVNGTIGEANSMTIDERKKVASAWMSAAPGRLSAIVVHIGAGNLRDSQDLARHAQEIQADAFACVSPTYYKPEMLEDYVSYMEQVASAAPALPFYLYDIDFITGVKFSVVDFFELAIPRIPNLRGVKHTTPSFPSMHLLLARFGEQIQVLQGSAETFLEGLAIGLEGNIIPSYMGPVLNRVKEAFDRGDLQTARKEQIRAVQVLDIQRKSGVTSISSFAKAVLQLMGLNVGQSRPPLSPVSDLVANQIKEELNKVGFFEWVHQ